MLQARKIVSKQAHPLHFSGSVEIESICYSTE